MERYVLYMGLNDKDSHVQMIADVEAYKIVRNIILSYVSGATIFSGSGIFQHDDGTIVIENTFRIELIGTDRGTVDQIISDLKRAFNQESILLTSETIQTDFI